MLPVLCGWLAAEPIGMKRNRILLSLSSRRDVNKSFSFMAATPPSSLLNYWRQCGSISVDGAATT